MFRNATKTTSPNQDLSERLVEVGRKTVLRPLKERGCDWVNEVGVWPVFEGMALSERGVLLSASDDPTVQSGEFYRRMPQQNREQLTRALPGFENLAVYTFHEHMFTPEQIARVERSGEIYPAIRPLGVTDVVKSVSGQLRQDGAQIGSDLGLVGKELGQTGKQMGKVVLPILGAALVATVVIGGSMLLASAVAVASVDPAVFGVMTLDDSGLGYWVLLTKWDWAVPFQKG